MSTRSGRIRPSTVESSPPRTRKGVSPPRSPARSPARSRKSSPPARTSSRKSPSRKSPSRKPTTDSKFPARKSPSRTTKETTEKAALKSPRKRAAIKSSEGLTVKLQDVTKLDIYRGTRARRSDYSIKDLSSNTSLNDIPLDKIETLNGDSIIDSDVYGLRNRKSAEQASPRRSSRLQDFIDSVPDIRRSLSKSVSKSISKSISQSLDTYSDEENSDAEMLTNKSEPVTRRLATPLRESVGRMAQYSSRWEFGGRLGSAVLMLLIPLVVFSILISCSKSCSMRSLLDLTAYKSLAVWFSIPTFGIVVGQYAIQAIFALLPVLGVKADRMDESGTKYCFNAFFSSIFTVNVLFMLHYFNIFNCDMLLKEYLRLAVISYLFGVIMSLILFIKSRKIDDSNLNPYGNTGYVLYDFCMGREIHPYIKSLDVKILVSRIANINALVLAVLIFKHGFHLPQNVLEELIPLDNYKELLSKVQLNPTILVYSMMQIIYILSFIMKEYKITTTFFWQSEGLGYLQIISSALYPFYFTTISKYVADTKLSLTTNTLISASVLYALGFFIMLISNNIKYEFRKNPLQPRLSHLDSMPTFHGKKLLVSTVWGALRHPNYTGDILIHIAFALPGILSQQYVAAAPALLTVVLLLHRAWRDHVRCRRRYGAAWERYCKRVPSVLIPKVL